MHGEVKMVRLCVWLCTLPVLTAAPAWAAEDGKGPSDMCRMCHEGIKSGTEAEAMKQHLSKKKK